MPFSNALRSPLYSLKLPSYLYHSLHLKFYDICLTPDSSFLQQVNFNLDCPHPETFRVHYLKKNCDKVPFLFIRTLFQDIEPPVLFAPTTNPYKAFSWVYRSFVPIHPVVAIPYFLLSHPSAPTPSKTHVTLLISRGFLHHVLFTFASCTASESGLSSCSTWLGLAPTCSLSL